MNSPTFSFLYQFPTLLKFSQTLVKAQPEKWFLQAPLFIFSYHQRHLSFYQKSFRLLLIGYMAALLLHKPVTLLFVLHSNSFGVINLTLTCWSPLPLPRNFGAPLPLRRKFVPVWVPAGIFNLTFP